MTARNHHFLSQCYLNGFTTKEKITCLDLKDRKPFKTNPRNVASKRDFNKIEMSGYPADFLEQDLANYLDYPASQAIQNVIRTGNFTGDDRSAILTLIAFFRIRSPYRRAYDDVLIDYLTKVFLSYVVESKATVINGIKIPQKFREHYNEGSFTFGYTQNQHIKLEFELINHLLPLLFKRKWVLIQAPDDLNFISCDFPVALLWKKPEKYNISPGFARTDTEIYFPLSKKIVLMGDFEGNDEVLYGSKKLVAEINSNILQFAHRHVYAPEDNFCFIGHNGELLCGLEELWKQIDSNKN